MSSTYFKYSDNGRSQRRVVAGAEYDRVHQYKAEDTRQSEDRDELKAVPPTEVVCLQGNQ